MITGFPVSPTPNVTDTTSVRLLQRFSSSLLFAEYPSLADAPPDLRVYWRKTELLFNILKALEENASNTSTVHRKKGKGIAKNRRIDPLPFDSMGITVPTTDAEVLDVYIGVLSQLQSILEVRRFLANGPCVELKSPSITSSFSGSRCCQRSSNPRTPRQLYHRKECLPQQRRKQSWGQISLRTQRFLWFNRWGPPSTSRTSRGLESGQSCYPPGPRSTYAMSGVPMSQS